MAVAKAVTAQPVDSGRRPVASLLRGALWLVTSSALLVVGTALGIFAFYGLLRATNAVEPGKVRSVQVLLTYYFHIVCFRGLLPALVVTLALWPALVHVVPTLSRGRLRLFGGLMLAAAVAYAFVGPLLLARQFAGTPDLKITGVANQAATAVLVVVAVSAAAWLPRVLLPALGPSRGPGRPGMPQRGA
jgi:hypothetical protein